MNSTPDRNQTTVLNLRCYKNIEKIVFVQYHCYSC